MLTLVLPTDNPKWDINIWDDEKEKTASNKVVVV